MLLLLGGALLTCTFLNSTLDGAEDARNLPVKSFKIKVDDGAARVQDHVDRKLAKRGGVLANHLAQTALDAIAIDRLAHHLADCQANARPGYLVRLIRRPNAEKEAHLLRKLLTAGRVDALIVRVFAETVGGRTEERHGGQAKKRSLLRF